jgi:hypothetical protein
VQTGTEFLSTSRTVGSGKKQLNLDELTKVAGHYLIQDENKTIQSLSYNFPRKESVSEYYSDKDLQSWIDSKDMSRTQLISSSDQSFVEAMADLNNGRQLWKYFIMLAILFLLSEMVIIRFWK